MKVIVQRNIYDNSIINIYDSKSAAAKAMGVTIQAIIQSIQKGCKCKDYRFEEAEIDNKKILDILNNDRGNNK